jgi:hypothetical protein
MEQSFKTGAAAAYLTSRGVATSKSHLEKCRARGPDDPRDHGPDFWRDQKGICFYEKAALDRWAAVHLSAREFRGQAAQPLNFRRAAR